MPATPPQMLRGAPYVPVADVARTGAYYRDVLLVEIIR